MDGGDAETGSGECARPRADRVLRNFVTEILLELIKPPDLATVIRRGTGASLCNPLEDESDSVGTSRNSGAHV